MKTKHYLSVISLFTVCSLCLISCDSDDKGDVVKPVITLHEPEEDAILEIGNEDGIHFDMDLSDDMLLNSYKINIHSNSDGHEHTKSTDVKSTDAKKAFTFDKVYDVSGLKNTHIHHHDIKIPANVAPGKYHLIIWCTDAAGNQTEIARNIVLSNSVKQ